MKAWLAAAITFGCVCLGAEPGAAQPYPAKPIHIVVATAPGGVTDLLGRSLAVELGRIFGQQVVVENRPGANSQIGAEFVAKSASDGYTLLLAPETAFVVNPSLYAKLPYDAEKDFTPVAGLAMVQQALVVHPSLPASTVAELVALAKARPGELNYGCAGIGSASHLNMELFKLLTDVKLVGVHYRGATPALTDVIAGHVSAMFVNIGSVLEPWKAGRVRVLAIGTAARLPEFPDLPTVAAACRASKRGPGSACLRRAAPPATSLPSSTPRSSASSRIQDTARECCAPTRCSRSPARPNNMQR